MTKQQGIAVGIFALATGVLFGEIMLMMAGAFVLVTEIQGAKNDAQ